MNCSGGHAAEGNYQVKTVCSICIYTFYEILFLTQGAHVFPFINGVIIKSALHTSRNKNTILILYDIFAPNDDILLFLEFSLNKKNLRAPN